MIMGIDNLERDGFGGRTSWVVIENSAVWRILSGRNIRRQRSVRVAVPAKTNRLLRFVQSNRSIRQVRAQLAQRRNVVQNPKRAPVRADDPIIAMNREGAHGSVGQVE